MLPLWQAQSGLALVSLSVSWPLCEFRVRPVFVEHHNGLPFSRVLAEVCDSSVRARALIVQSLGEVYVPVSPSAGARGRLQPANFVIPTSNDELCQCCLSRRGQYTTAVPDRRDGGRAWLGRGICMGSWTEKRGMVGGRSRRSPWSKCVGSASAIRSGLVRTSSASHASLYAPRALSPSGSAGSAPASSSVLTAPGSRKCAATAMAVPPGSPTALPRL